MTERGTSVGQPAVAKMVVVLDRDVEAVSLEWVDGTALSGLDERRALAGVLRTVTFPLPRDVARTPEALRAHAGLRPHARLRVSCQIYPDGSADAEIRWIGGGEEDVGPGEYPRLEERALALTAAAILERLAQLNAGAQG